MKTLVIGGYAQGKLAYVKQQFDLSEYEQYDRVLPVSGTGGKNILIDHLHLWVKKQLEEQNDPETVLRTFLEKQTNWILISDEVGNGIVPMGTLEREYRERTGRMLITVAQQADEVIRVVCGIGQKLK
mgnify:CR=1 FL=1